MYNLRQYFMTFLLFYDTHTVLHILEKLQVYVQV